jgi:hypothetical protein
MTCHGEAAILAPVSWFSVYVNERGGVTTHIINMPCQLEVQRGGVGAWGGVGWGGVGWGGVGWGGVGFGCEDC